MKIYLKWSALTMDQKSQIIQFYQEELAEKKITLNQRSYLINPANGNFVPRKDF